MQDAERFYQHIHWLQARFPEAAYEDITGLCKVANLEDLKEQEYSLNPGRHVGVVIEEDGKTEEEFIEGVLDLDLKLSQLNREAASLEDIITANVKRIAGAE